MNKNWKKGIFFLLLFLAVMPMIHMYREQRMQKEIAEKILRFHVIANSDSREDQEFMILESRFLEKPAFAVEQGRNAAKKSRTEKKQKRQRMPI